MVLEDPAFPFINSRKCMIEMRSYCSGSYKGYIYCTGFEEAEKIRKVVRKLVAERISPQAPVTVTHGCSEYAKAFPGFAKTQPASAVMKYKNEWQATEEYFDNNTVVRHVDIDYSDNIPYVSVDGLVTYERDKIISMQQWLRYAATIGDMSYLEITGGRKVTPLPPMYMEPRPPFKNTIPIKKNN
jgi:hypothetical protein